MAASDVASVWEKRPGCWEVRVSVGYDDEGKPVQVSRVILGGKRDEYLEHMGPSWSLSCRRDYGSRAERINGEQIGAKPVIRLSVAEVDRWHLRMHKAGVGETQIRNLHTLLRAGFSQAVRWELLPTNPVDGRLIIDQAIAIDRTHPVGDPDRLQVSSTETGERRGRRRG